VLIVDDHQDSLAMYAFVLLAMGFQPVIARTAEDGFARARKLHPDVIVAHIMRPGSSSLELTRRVRADTRTKEAGIIVLMGDAFGSAPEHERVMTAGCDRVLLTPCLPDALALEIRDVLIDRRHAFQPGSRNDDVEIAS
jgi:two-component system phosphate regulon response regulator PhoB